MKTTPSEAECIEHAKSIARIPESDFPDWTARFHLILRALGGADIYAYQPFGQTRWVLFIETESKRVDQRWTVEEYTRQFNLERETAHEEL